MYDVGIEILYQGRFNLLLRKAIRTRRRGSGKKENLE
jgi:hypothetical protein